MMKIAMDRLDVAKNLAGEIGKFLKDSFRAAHTVTRKKDGTVVTEIDVEAERRILAVITSSFSEDAIVAEEGGSRDGTSGFTWYIDPLDGTTNFAAGLPIFATSIAFADSEGMAGAAIAMPMFDAVVYAGRGKGAYWNEKKMIMTAPQLEEPVSLFAYSDRRDPRVVAFMGKFPRTRILGSAVAQFCLVASGAAHGFFALAQHPWDYAASLVVIPEAGGRVVTLDGTPASAGGTQDLLAGPLDQIETFLEMAQKLIS